MARNPHRGKGHIDKEQVRLQRDMAKIIHSGTLEEFKSALRAAGIDPDSPRGKALVDRLIALGPSGRSPQ